MEANNELSMSKKKILFFAPFGGWIVHTQLDCVLGVALKNRGCEVHVLSCDGLFEGCLAAGTPPTTEQCERCQATGNEWFTRFGLPATPMSALLTDEDRERVRQWAMSVDLAQPDAVLFEGLPVVRWMLMSMHSVARRGRLPLEDATVMQRPRQLLVHGALTALATQRMLKQYQPDIGICYSGSNSYYRCFFEVARSAGLKMLAHERGSVDGSFALCPDRPTYEMMSRLPAGWQAWKDVPLTEGKLDDVLTFFENRAAGKNTNFQTFHQFKPDALKVRRRLRLDNERKNVLLTPSGDWEFGMMQAYGEASFLWPSQFEWLETTARICSERGWNLIIRQHPLGIGTKTYPRATEFLSEMIQPRDWLAQDHVRMVMPGENLSTYDLFEIADVVVALFSRTPAEALARGVPAICVSDNSLFEMGIPVLRDVAEYEPMLVKALETGLCVDVERLRQAYRFASFRFSIASCWQFSSVGVKNVYEPDFRLSSPEDLVPGVDPLLDRVCSHLLEGTALWPEPESRPQEEDETRALQARRQAIISNRTAVRTNWERWVEPAILIVRVCTMRPPDGPVGPPPGWRSRHKNVAFGWCRLDAGGGIPPFVATLQEQVRLCPQPFIILLPEGVRLDESALSQALDLLSSDDSAQRLGAVMGCYVCDTTGRIGPEWNTALHAPQSDSPPFAGIEALQRPLAALSLTVWRTAALAAWTTRMAEHVGTTDDRWIPWIQEQYLDQGQFIRLPEPVVILPAPEAVGSVMNRARTLVTEGKVDEAMDELEIIRRESGYIKGLRLQAASWLVEAKRHEMALPLIYAEFQSGTGNSEAWALLTRALPEVRLGKHLFERFWPAVDRTPGYMAPGQEKFLHNKVRSLPPNASILEIGSFQGRSTVAMAYACVGTKRQIHCVDTFCGNPGIMGTTAWFMHIFRGNLRRWGLDTYINIHQGYSHPVVRAMPDQEMFDFAFIDASHEYADVLLDFELVYPRIKPGGYIAFHDVAPGWPGSWRVWEQTGKPLLDSHEVCDTLTCGRKRAGIPWNSHEATWPGYLQALVRQWRSEGLYLAEMDALEKIITGHRDAPSEDTLVKSPDRVVESLHWMAKKETHTDPWVHYCAALVQWQRNPAEAQAHLENAHRSGLHLTPLC